MKNQCIAIAITFFGILSCNESGKSNDLKTDTEGVFEKVFGKSGEEWNGKLDEILTLEMASTAIGYDGTEAKKDYNQVLRNPSTHSIAYRWKKGRQKSIKNPVTGENMDIPTDDFVELSWVKTTTLKAFRHNYHTPTAEELVNADKVMNSKLKEMESEGKISGTQASTAKGLVGVLGEDLSFDEVSGVGDYAVWNNKHKQLKVFHQGLEFQIMVETGNSESANRKMSVDVAKTIIQEKLK